MAEKLVSVKLKEAAPKNLYFDDVKVTNYRFDMIPLSIAKDIKEAGYKLVKRKVTGSDDNEDFEGEEDSSEIVNQEVIEDDNTEEEVEEKPEDTNEIDSIVDSEKRNKNDFKRKNRNRNR